VRFETKGGDQFQVLTPVLFLSSRHTSRGWSGCANARRGRPSPFCHTELYRSRTMIVCSCNVLSVSDVRACLNSGPDCPRTPAQVYQCLGCSPDCGRYARMLRSIMSSPTRSAPPRKRTHRTRRGNTKRLLNTRPGAFCSPLLCTRDACRVRSVGAGCGRGLLRGSHFSQKPPRPAGKLAGFFVGRNWHPRWHRTGKHAHGFVSTAERAALA